MIEEDLYILLITAESADDDAEIDVPQSDNHEQGHAEAAAVDEDTSDYSAHQIINCKGEANEDNSVRCPLAVSCLCLGGVGMCQYQREPMLFPCVLQAPWIIRYAEPFSPQLNPHPINH